MITNLGHVATIIAKGECDEIFGHADISAWGAPSECHDDFSRGEAERFREMRRHAEATARRPWRVIVKELKARGLPIDSLRWMKAVGRIYRSLDYPF